MQYEVITIEEYFKSLPEERVEDYVKLYESHLKPKK